MKYDTFSEYDSRHANLAESAFLTVWPSLGQWHNNLVLVGGLVPKYLCGDHSESRSLPRPATLDVDLGIALATDSGQYGSIAWELGGQGFYVSKTHSPRLEKVIGDFTVYLDFLVEHPNMVTGSARVDEVTASIMPGVERALATAREVEIRGVDLHGAKQKITARVCEVGAFLALKLRAFCHRQQPKDAFDILYTILHYDGGVNAAIAAFAEEVRLGNPACPDALRSLREHFADEGAPGPVKASHFIFGQAESEEPEDTRFLRTNLRQDMVAAAAKLITAVDALAGEKTG